MGEVKDYTNRLRDKWGEEKYQRFSDFLQWYAYTVSEKTQFVFRKKEAIEAGGMSKTEADEIEQFLHAIAHIIRSYNELKDYAIPIVE